MRKPIWIVFEGIDGSGKTTQAKLLDDYLNSHGVRSLYKHVFDTEAGRLLRGMFIENAFSNTVEILVLSAARQAFLDEMAALADDYDVLIVDRFFLSILAMQGVDDESVELIEHLRDSICEEWRDHVVFHVSTPPDDCSRRLQKRSARDRIEKKGVDFHQVVFDRYATLLSDEQNVRHIDGVGDVETIHRRVVASTLRLLGAAAEDDPAAASRRSPSTRPSDAAAGSTARAHEILEAAEWVR
ncbi:dTMP kinase [Cellulomonas sp. URHB0016]